MGISLVQMALKDGSRLSEPLLLLLLQRIAIRIVTLWASVDQEQPQLQKLRKLVKMAPGLEKSGHALRAALIVSNSTW